MKQIDEKLQEVPIKFYETPSGLVEYESPYMKGYASSADSALKQILDKQIDLLYDLHLYDDVEGVSIGSYKLADKKVKSRGRDFLGQLSIKLDLEPTDSDNTIAKASKKKTRDVAQQAHDKAVKSYFKEQKKKEFISNLKRIIEKIFRIKLESEYRMDLTKKYVLQFMHESQEEKKPSRARRLSKKRMESRKRRTHKVTARMEAVRKRRAKLEDASDWSFNASDMGMSGSPTFTYNKPVTLDDIGGLDGLDPIDIGPFNIISPDIEAAVGQNDGFFMLLFTGEPDSEYGFHAEFGDGTMIYGYANSLDELKSQVEFLAKYITLPADIPYDEFQADLDGIKANEDDETMDMGDAGADMGSMDAGADMSGSADMGSTQDMSVDGAMNEDSQYYLFSVPANITVIVIADSAEMAKEILRQNSSIDLADPVEFARGDAEVRSIKLDDVDSAIELGE